MIPSIPTLLLLLVGCGSSQPTPAPPTGPKMNYPPPPPRADPLPVVPTWEDLATQDNRWAELRGILVQRPGGKTPNAILFTYIQLDDGTLVSIGARMPEAWQPMLNQEIALVGIVTRCLHREVSQRFSGPFVDDWEMPRVLDAAPTLASEEVVRAAQNRVFSDCLGAKPTKGG